MDVIYIFFFIFRNTMGCNGSKGISKNPAKSVTANDTFINDYDDSLSIEQTIHQNNNKTANVQTVDTISGNHAKKPPNGHANNTNVSPKTTTTNGHVLKGGLGAPKQNNTQFLTVISSNKTVYGKQKKPQNSQNITNVVDLEDYEYDIPNDQVDKPNDKAVNGYVVNNNSNQPNNKPVIEHAVMENVNPPKEIKEQNVKVIAPINGVKKTKPVSKNTENILNVVDLEDYDFSSEQVNSTFNNRTVNGDTEKNNNKSQNCNGVKENGVVSGPNKDLSFSLNSRTKSVHDVKRTVPPVPKNTNVTNVVDLEDYDYSNDQVHDSLKYKDINRHEETSNNTARNGNTVKENSSVSGQNKNPSFSIISSNKPMPGVRRTTQPVSKNTDNITHVVDLDLEEYDFSTDQVHNSFNNKNINGQDTSNITAKIGNSDKENSSVSGQNKSQPLTIISSNKPMNGVRRTIQPVSTKTENITDVLDLEEYEL
jgi:hypothetical protein